LEGDAISIRMAQEADFDQWLPLWKGYQTFYKTSISDETTAITWARFHNPSEPMHCAVAEQDGKLIGMVHYIQHRSCWTTGDYMYLQDLFVDPQVRDVARDGADRACVRAFSRGRRLARLVAHPRVQFQCHAALRPHCRQERLPAVPQGDVTAGSSTTRRIRSPGSAREIPDG
jgi:hypothetical protein